MKRLLLPIVFLCPLVALAQSYNYEGPSVLSRGPRNLGILGGENIRMNFFGSVDAVYDSGMYGFAADEKGQLLDEAAYGVQIAGGVTGKEDFKRSSVALMYRGDYAYYTQKTYYNGFNHALSLSSVHQVNARLSIQIQAAAGLTNRSIGSYASMMYNPFDYNAVPAYELFNNPTAYGEGRVGASYRLSSRSQLQFGGSTFIVRRRASGLVGMMGYTATGDFVRQITRSTSIGGGYSFTNYRYSKMYGSSDLHTVTFSIQHRINRDWNIRAELSGFRIESTGLVQVQLDPIVAQILGQGSGVEAFHNIYYLNSYRGSLSRSWRRASLSIGAYRGVFPGNGVYLTSLTTGVTGSYSYQLGKWNVGAQAGYDEWKSLTRSMPPYRNFSGGAGVSRQLTRIMHLTVRWDYRDMGSDLHTYDRAGQRASVGLAFSPPDVPLTMW